MSEGDAKQNENKAKGEGPGDDELSQLLDSALKDFSSGSGGGGDDSKPEEGKELAKAAATATEKAEGGEEVEWTDEFIKQAAAQFESNLANMFGGADGSLSQEQLQQGFQKIAEAASQVLSNPSITDDSSDFASTISQTLQGLSEGAENLQNPFSERDLMSMFGGGGVGGGVGTGQGGEQNAFMPFMQGMMQSLLSKEVLYPSLKDILERYPAWLEQNSPKLSAEDVERYGKQQQLMRDVCAQLELESDADTPERKREQFDKVLALMQKLQDYGQPPVDLVGDVGPGLQFDAQGNPDPSQCCIA